MNRDDHMAAEQHQLELERRRADEDAALLRADPDYERWLDKLNDKVTHEIPRESLR